MSSWLVNAIGHLPAHLTLLLSMTVVFLICGIHINDKQPTAYKFNENFTGQEPKLAANILESALICSQLAAVFISWFCINYSR